MQMNYKHERKIVIAIKEDGYYPICIEAQDRLDLQIIVDKHINASLFITYHGVDVICNCKMIAKENSQSHLLFWNEITSSFQLEQSIEIQRDAQLTIGYGDLTQAKINMNMKACLVEKGANLHVIHTCISAQQKHYQLQCIHEVANTSSNMENYCVVKEHGDYRMEATGKVQKGAYQSASLQTTRVLTMSEQQTSEVVPLLLIDENDVKAGHATTLGQPDENQLYYLQTRGLSRMQALSLLIIGYMMPIVEVIQQDKVRAQLQKDIEEKVGYHA